MSKYKQIFIVFIIAISAVSFLAISKTLAKNLIIADTPEDNVGIGTSNPQYKLDVQGHSNISGGLSLNGITQKDFIYSYYEELDLPVGTPTSWYKVATPGGALKNIKMLVTVTGDNTQSRDEFFISMAGYNFKHNIIHLPSTRYNGSKLLAIKTNNYGTTGTTEIWIKVDSVDTSAGTLKVYSTENIPSLVSGTPTFGGNWAVIDLDSNIRDTYSTSMFRGLRAGISGNTSYFGGPVSVSTPTIDSHAATKNYVDSSIIAGGDGYIGNSGSHTAGGDLDMNNNNITNIQNIISSNRVMPRLVLDSTGGGDNWTSQGAYISIGESGALGPAAMHMTYRGDGYGWIGSGAVSNGIPGASYFQFDYDNNFIDTNSRLDMSNQRISTLGTPINDSDAATKGYADSLVSGNTYWSVSGSDIYNNNSGNVGISMDSPDDLLTIGNQSDMPANVSLGAWVGMYLGQQSSSWGGLLGHNMKVASDGSYDVAATHSSFGYRGIEFDYSGDSEGIKFHAYRGSVTAGNTASSERMRITNTGNVGIGTTSPGYKLDVIGSGAFRDGNNSYLYFGPNSSWGGKLYIGATGNKSSSSQTAQVISTSGNLHLDPGPNDKIYLGYYNNTSVGINTSPSTSYALDVSGAGSFSGTVGVATPVSNSHAATKSYVDGMVNWLDNGSYIYADNVSGDNVVVTDTGRLGVGTTSPTEALDVEGNLQMNQNVILNPLMSDLEFTSAGSMFGLINNKLVKADEKYTVTCNSSANIDRIFNNDGDSSANWGDADLPVVCTIDFGNMKHYWKAIAINFPYSRYTSGVKIEKFYDNRSDNDWDACSSGDPSLVWATEYDTTSNTESTIYDNSGWGNGVCKIRVTLSGTSNYADDIRIGEIAGWQYYYGMEGAYVEVTGGNMYGNLYMNNNQIRDVGTPTSGTHAVNKSYVDSSISDVVAGSTHWTLNGSNIYNSNSGNVGIGATSPSYKLHVIGDGYFSGILRSGPIQTYSIPDSTWAYTLTTASGSGNNSGFWVNSDGTADMRLRALNSAVKVLLNSNGSPSYINGGGNVGINTNSPSYKLDVSGTGRFTGNLIVPTPTSGSHATTKDYVDGLASKWTLSGNNIYNNNSGNVSIGTTDVGSINYGTGGKVVHIGEGDDGEITQLYVGGDGQGTGYILVGQNTSYGGGITYNGDDSPDMPQSSDHFSLFVRSSGVDTEVLHWSHNSTVAQFEGEIDMNNNRISNLSSPVNTNDAATKGYVDSSIIADNYIGTGGDHTSSGNLNMNNNLITNIGNSGTDFTLSGGLNLVDRVYTVNNNLDIFENVASYYSGSTPTTGTVAVTINNTPNMMIEAEIVIQGYNGLTTCQIRGYTHTGSADWHQPFGSCVSSGHNGGYTVRFANEVSDDDRVILIGNTSSSWGNYPQVVVTRVTKGYPGAGDNIGDWSIDIVSDESIFDEIEAVDINDGFTAYEAEFTGSTYSILAGNDRIGNVASPVNNSDAATKGYVDSAVVPADGYIGNSGTHIAGGDLNMSGNNIVAPYSIKFNNIEFNTSYFNEDSSDYGRLAWDRSEGFKYFNDYPSSDHWATIWDSDNDGLGSSLDADLLDGYNSSTSASANTIALRDSNGRLSAASPVNSGDLTTKSYVDSAVAGTSDGTVTSVGTGTGLTGGPITTSGTISFDAGWGDGRYIRSDADDSFTGKLTASASNRQSGIYGTYSSTKIDHIWSMGTSYKIASDGSDFGNLYGLAYKHTNNPTGGTMAGGHQMVWTNSGTPRSAMGYNGFWTVGDVTASGGSFTNTVSVGTPTAGNHATTKSYVDGLVGGNYLEYGVGGTLDVDSTPGISKLYVGSSGAWTNRGPTGHNGSALFSMHTHPGDYYSQLWFDTNGDTFYHRTMDNAAWRPWDEVWTSGNDGSGSGLSADNLDGVDSGSFLRSDANDTFTASSLTLDSGAYLKTRLIGSLGTELGIGAGEMWSTMNGNITGEYLWLGAENGIKIVSSPDNMSSGWAGRHEATLVNTAGNSIFPGDITATAYYYSSDKRLKDNIVSLEGESLEVLDKLNPVSFTWKEDGGASIGFLAQEVEQVLPELVKTNSETDMKSVQYGNLTALLTASVKEQQKEIERLENKVETLETKLNILLQK